MKFLLNVSTLAYQIQEDITMESNTPTIPFMFSLHGTEELSVHIDPGNFSMINEDTGEKFVSVYLEPVVLEDPATGEVSYISEYFEVINLQESEEQEYIYGYLNENTSLDKGSYKIDFYLDIMNRLP